MLIIGALMHLVEGPANGFTSIPIAVYWAVTTMTTVGFGDIVPRTDLGRAIATLMMLMGWGVLAVPTGGHHALARAFAPGRDPHAIVGREIHVHHRVRRVIGVLATHHPFVGKSVALPGAWVQAIRVAPSAATR